ncbi:hypothetical protein GUJ93_ZPchr0006g46152 [Zizania palustris]|uniref:Uncharacterized protein n=1 Tax=Zizania palustris TaxID=103762 RepID=A0A8J5VXM4_ZIZPA|nr:hypothetical protein GUJ93_ZPchr0006g46152 [Zizania palustris]
MDAEMAFLMANQGLARPGKLVYDPFVGTGSILVAAAHYGAMTMGADIDIRVVLDGHGPDYNIWSNFEQYKLSEPLCVLRADNNVPPWRSGLKELRTQASQEQKFEAKKTSLHEQPSKIYSAKSVQAPHTRCFEQASHFTLRKSGQPSEDFDQVLSDSNWCWASYAKVYTHTKRTTLRASTQEALRETNRASLVSSEVLPRVTQSDSTL